MTDACSLASLFLAFIFLFWSRVGHASHARTCYVKRGEPATHLRPLYRKQALSNNYYVWSRWAKAEVRAARPSYGAIYAFLATSSRRASSSELTRPISGWKDGLM